MEKVRRGKGLTTKSSVRCPFVFLYGVTAALSHEFSNLVSNKGITYCTILSQVQHFITFLFLQSDS